MQEIKKSQTKHINFATNRDGVHGLTLIELLVAMVISLLVALSAVGVLVVARQGFRSVDSGSQLRDDGRFATELLTRVIQQAGYQDIRYAGATRSSAFRVAGDPVPDPFVEGVNNAILSVGSTPLVDTVANSRSSNCPAAQKTACANGSDVLVLRYQASRSPIGTSDGATLNCAGFSATVVADNQAETIENIIFLGFSDGEPALMCRFRNSTSTTWEDPMPVVKGVESFQVLYGTDGVTPNSAVLAAPDSVAERYLTSSQITVPGNPVATANNWRRVRALRIGLVLRAEPGSSVSPEPITYYPLGRAMFNAANDPGSQFGPINDPLEKTRLRQTMTFTINLRNPQGV